MQRIAPRALDVGATGSPIVGTDAGVRTREQRHDVVKAVPHVTTNTARRPARRRPCVIEVIKPLDQRLHLIQEVDERRDW